jgi:scyllo-inosamine-4-phosphate amidinotransferase 1
MIVNSKNEWDQLKSVIVGTADNAFFPTRDPIFKSSMEGGGWDETPPPSGAVPFQIIEETNEDLEALCEVLVAHDVNVLRPDAVELQEKVSTLDWTTDGMYSYCPRDTLLVVDDLVIESPMAYRARQHEAVIFSTIRREAIADNARWISAPRPRLQNKITDELDPIFDAANVCRLGNDLLYLVSSSGNRAGAKWLQNVLGQQYKVHICDMYKSTHIDSTIVPLNDHTVVLNASRVNEDNCPAVFKDWDKIYVDDCNPIPFHSYPYASKWIGLNMLAINPSTVIVDQNQPELITRLEQKNFTVIPLQLRHSRTLGGGFHCVTLDLERN